MIACADDGSVGQTAAVDADQGYAAQRERMRTLSKALEKANRAGKPLIISRLPGSRLLAGLRGHALPDGRPRPAPGAAAQGGDPCPHSMQLQYP